VNREVQQRVVHTRHRHIHARPRSSPAVKMNVPVETVPFPPVLLLAMFSCSPADGGRRQPHVERIRPRRFRS